MVQISSWMGARAVQSNTLILCQCHLQREEQGKLLGVCLELLHRLNPYDFLLIDNASPLDPLSFIIPHDDRPVDIFRFPDAIGHFSPKFVHEHEEPKDGPGRANMTGLQMARASGYDRVVYIESDSLVFRPLEEGFAKMTKPVACLPRLKWGYCEWAIWWNADIPWLVDTHKFIEKYDWPSKTKHHKEGERIYEDILGPHLQILPWKGDRGDWWPKPDGTWAHGWITADNLKVVYPDGLDWITHVQTPCFAEALRMNGHADLVSRL